jgi:hypothetical protein
MSTITASSGNTSTSITVKRPKYDDLLVPYKVVAPKSACDVFAMVHPDLEQKCRNGDPEYQNACATRMSYALNKGGYKIKLPRKFQDYHTGEPYVTAILDMITFLRENFGGSDVQFNGDAYAFKKSIAGKKGIILFEIKWDDANGHVTLWDGTSCVDGSYHFSDNPANILFWELK